MNTSNKVFNSQLPIFNFFYRWHPEVALRYLPIVKRIKQDKEEFKTRELKILEVGSGSLGIAPYLKMPVTGLDVDFSGPKFPLLKPAQGKTTKIPFKDKSFDLVLSVDLLEHLPQDKREKAVQEMLRVARKAVIIAAPCGKKALFQDKKLDEEYRQIFDKPFPYLKEHLKHGLPEKEEILELIKKNQKKPQIQVQVMGNENLALRYFLMRGWMTKNIFTDLIFRKAMLFLIPLFRLLNRPPYYRQIFFVKIT